MIYEIIIVSVLIKIQRILWIKRYFSLYRPLIH